MGDDVLKFASYRQQQDDDDDLVRCARCGKLILGTSLRCPQCGVNFQGQAQDFYHASEMPSDRRKLWAVILLVVFTLSAFFL